MIDVQIIGGAGAVLVGALVGLVFSRREAARKPAEAAAAAAAWAPDRSNKTLIAALESYSDPHGDQGMPEVLLAVWRARFLWEVYNLVPERPDVRVDGQLLEWDGMLCVTAFSTREAAHGSGLAREPYALIESNSGHILSLAVQEHINGGLLVDPGTDHTVRVPRQEIVDFLYDEPDDEGH